MPEQTALIYLGRINGVHGVRGWVKIHSDCRPRETIFSYSTFIAKRGSRSSSELKLTDGRTQGKGLVAKFEGIDDRDSAYALNGLSLYVPRSALPEPDEDEFYWADLIGLTVINQTGETLGEVKELFETGANDVMIVRSPNNKEILIPFAVPEYVLEVDFERNVMTVDWSLDWLENE
ncbi:ribosome maturation factor RimM [Cardiobacteriaceae bacterium TAE3-ERU3]|nr:ribosome maturation factor RimM [Cardiobacteriaceae bacterium TAE3-ERU3]